MHVLIVYGFLINLHMRILSHFFHIQNKHRHGRILANMVWFIVTKKLEMSKEINDGNSKRKYIVRWVTIGKRVHA